MKHTFFLQLFFVLLLINTLSYANVPSVPPSVTIDSQYCSRSGLTCNISNDQICSPIQDDAASAICSAQGLSFTGYRIPPTSFRCSNSDGSSLVLCFTPAFTEVETRVCDDSDYPIPSDLDDDGLIDICYAITFESDCDSTLPIFNSSQSLSSPELCVTVPLDDGSSISCRYTPLQNPDGSSSSTSYGSTLEGCNCDVYDCEELPGNDEVPNQNCFYSSNYLFCRANEEDECRTIESGDGLFLDCNPNCGYYDDVFVCIDEVTDDLPSPCADGDVRPECEGVSPGECPNGFLLCEVDSFPTDDIDSPQLPDACVDGDLRPECQGIDVGDTPPQIDVTGVEQQLIELNAKSDLSLEDLSQIANNTARTADNTRSIIDRLDEFAGDAIPDSQSFEDRQDASIDAAVDEFSNFEDSKTYQSEMEEAQSYFSSLVSSYLPAQTQCVPLELDYSQISGVGRVLQIDICEFADALRVVFYWILYGAFLYYCYITLTRRLVPSPSSDD